MPQPPEQPGPAGEGDPAASAGGGGEVRRCHGPRFPHGPQALKTTRGLLQGYWFSPRKNLPFAFCAYRAAARGAH